MQINGSVTITEVCRMIKREAEYTDKDKTAAIKVIFKIINVPDWLRFNNIVYYEGSIFFQTDGCIYTHFLKDETINSCIDAFYRGYKKTKPIVKVSEYVEDADMYDYAIWYITSNHQSYASKRLKYDGCEIFIYPHIIGIDIEYPNNAVSNIRIGLWKDRTDAELDKINISQLASKVVDFVDKEIGPMIDVIKRDS